MRREVRGVGARGAGRAWDARREAQGVGREDAGRSRLVGCVLCVCMCVCMCVCVLVYERPTSRVAPDSGLFWVT